MAYVVGAGDFVKLAAELAVQLNGVTITRGGVPVVQDFSLRIVGGEVIAIRGPNGSGKSSLLSVVSGQSMPATGSVSVLGHQLTLLRPPARSRFRRKFVGFIFQGDELLPELTLGENVSLPLRLNGERDRESIRQLVGAVMGRLEVGDLIDRYPGEVSGGQLQRASVARALVHEPPIVLADEPTASLDANAAARAVNALIDLGREGATTVLIVTHDDAVASQCDREVWLDRHSSAVPPPFPDKRDRTK